MIAKELSSGISHIEDIPLSEFIRVVNTLHEYEITEKLDGAQILFGIDDIGFYTSRESKGGGRIYNESKYGLEFQNTYIRSAHKLLEQSLPALRGAGLRPGDQVEAEVLYGELPNVVPYSADRNYLIFLRTTEGQVNIDRLKERLDGQSLSVSLVSPLTEDGKTIQFREETNSWQFSRAPKITVSIPEVQKLIAEKMASLMSYLKQPSGIQHFSNFVIESTPLNKRPEWCEPQNWKFVKEEVREKRAEISKKISEQYMPAIKDVLLEQFVHSQHSSFGPLSEDGGWIEGVVARHPQSGKMIKIVDKTHFGVIREFAWKVRNNLIERARSADSQSSFLGSMYVRMATATGHPELGTMQAKNYLRKAGTITEERLNTLSVGINVNLVKEYWLALLEQKETELEQELAKYEKEKVGYYIENTQRQRKTQGDGKVYYSPGIDKRTKEVFASLFEQIKVLKTSVDEVTDSNQLFQILVGKQLNDLT